MSDSFVPSSAKKRGRPRKHDVPELPSRSRKTALNQRYLDRAMGVLFANPDPDGLFAWLAQVDVDEVVDTALACGDDYNAQNLRIRPRLRVGVLTELGREPHDGVLLGYARQICLKQPRTSREAVALIRLWRTGRAPEADVGKLAQQLLRVVAEYEATHSGCTTEVQTKAIYALLAMLGIWRTDPEQVESTDAAPCSVAA